MYLGKKLENDNFASVDLKTINGTWWVNLLWYANFLPN